MENVEKVKRDNRAISDEFFERFKPGKDLHPFVKLVKEYENELEFCFRGNDNSVSIYYNSHQVFKIAADGSVEAGFRIARYCEDWQERLNKLEEAGFVGGEAGKKLPIRSNVNVPLVFNELRRLYEEIMSPMFIRFFSVQGKDGTVDYFDEKTCKPKRALEKISQQELYRKLKNTKSGYFLHDMEFHQPHSNIYEQRKDENNNEPDMLGVYFNDSGDPERLVLVEVKCTEQSVNDKKSGLDKHISCMENYAGCEEHIRARRREAFEIIKQYAELELRGLSKEFAASYDEKFYEKHFKDMPVEALIVLTDEAKECSPGVKKKYNEYDEVEVENLDAKLYSRVF